MSLLSTIAGYVGLGSSAGTASTDESGNVYTFSQQQKDFIKLQFKYGLLLKQKLAAGSITQEYYDSNFWLTTEQLEPPYNGWLDEFKAAIQSEDLNWLAKQVGETVDQLTVYMGDALGAVASAAGNIVGTAISSTSTGLVEGFFGSLNPVGWLVVIGIGAGIYWGFKKGYIQQAFKTGAKTAIL